jgi:ribosome biogenesis GTPase
VSSAAGAIAFAPAGGDNGLSMARRKKKGKSERRIKDWKQRYRSGRADTGAQRQRLAPRAVKLPAFRLEAPEENLDDLEKVGGLVVSMFRGGSAVRRNDTGEELLCGIAKTFRAPENATALTVGDEVTVALAPHAEAADDADRDRADGMIVSREPRRTVLSRPQPRSGKRRDEYDNETFEKVIAANMDVLLIVAAVRQPPIRPGLLDRFLIIAERGELAPVLVVNKCDLGSPPAGVMASMEDLGVEILLTSAERGDGLDALAQRLGGKRSVLAGASGVGKSTLVNALVPEADAATRAVRAKDSRGRHTTSQSVVYDLAGGGLLVDTPGVRELGIHLDAAELPWYFPEFEEVARRCRFNDCTHTHEPACAVLEAVEQGAIPRPRYESYLRILDSLGENLF